MAGLTPWLLHLPQQHQPVLDHVIVPIDLPCFASLVLASLFPAPNTVACAAPTSQARCRAGRRQGRSRAHETDTVACARQRRSRYTTGQSSTARPRQTGIRRASTSR